jgi:hypothetical protein
LHGKFITLDEIKTLEGYEMILTNKLLSKQSNHYIYSSFTYRSSVCLKPMQKPRIIKRLSDVPIVVGLLNALIMTRVGFQLAFLDRNVLGALL